MLKTVALFQTVDARKEERSLSMTKALRILRLALAVFTVVVCLLLCRQTISIYQTGNRPENFSSPGVRIEQVYSREVIGQKLAEIAPVITVYLVLIVAGLILQAACGYGISRAHTSQHTGDHSNNNGYSPGLHTRKSTPMAEDTLRRLRTRIAELPAGTLAEQRRRRTIWLVAGSFIAICIIPCAWYLLRQENFTSLELEPVIGSMLLHVAPWTALAFAAACLASWLCGKSIQKEIDLLKDTLKQKAYTASSKKKSTPAKNAASTANAVSTKDIASTTDTASAKSTVSTTDTASAKSTVSTTDTASAKSAVSTADTASVKSSSSRMDAASAKDATKAGMPLAVCRLLVFAAAIILIVLGLQNGGMWDVLVKAINICTECIGLG